MPMEAQKVGWFFLHNLIKVFPEREISGCKSAQGFPSDIVKGRSWWIPGLRQRIDLGELLYEVNAGCWVTVDQKAAPGYPNPKGLRPNHKVSLLWYIAVVVRRHDEILAALALVRTRNTHIDHPVVPHVINDAEHLGRNLEN